MNKKKAILFWIKSSRGTNRKSVYLFDKKATKAQIESALESWCATFGCWNMSENMIRYGWEEVSYAPKSLIDSMYEEACNKKTEAVENWERLAAIKMAGDIPEVWL